MFGGSRLVFGLVLALTVPMGACGSEPTARTPARLSLKKPPPEPWHTKDVIARSTIKRAVKAGLGKFLRYIDLVGIPDAKGKFLGFRVMELLGPEGTWEGVDVKPGDVVTRLNGFPVMHYSSALKAFESLAVSSEIFVSYLRDGKPKELRIAIVDDAILDAPAGAPKTIAPSEARTFKHLTSGE